MKRRITEPRGARALDVAARLVAAHMWRWGIWQHRLEHEGYGFTITREVLGARRGADAPETEPDGNK